METKMSLWRLSTGVAIMFVFLILLWLKLSSSFPYSVTHTP